VTEYFVNHGSNVYIAALDARKAFDRVNHVKMFNVLLDRGVPGRLVKVIADWYGNLSLLLNGMDLSLMLFSLKVELDKEESSLLSFLTCT